MKARAKTDSRHPVWIYGEYVTESPSCPADGRARKTGHYIDKGGYPGANVYEIKPESLCMDTGMTDSRKCGVFEKDFLLFETDGEISYLMIWDRKTAADIITGEISSVRELPRQNIRIIGNSIDFPDFTDGIRGCMENGAEIPYLPSLNVMGTDLPFMKLTCLKCGHVTLSCSYTAVHGECGGYFSAGFATGVCRNRKEKKASA